MMIKHKIKYHITSIFLTSLVIAVLLSVTTLYAQSEQDINAINDVGLLYYNSGNYEEAVAEFNKILKLKPDHDVAYFNLGCVYQKKKNWKEAERAFASVLDLIPEDSEAKKRLVSVSENWSKQILSELAAQPDNASLHNDLGRAYISMGKLDEAYAEISKALSLKGDLAAGYYNLATLYVKKGSPQKALEEIKKACDIDSKNIIFQNYFKKVTLLNGGSASETPDQQPVPIENAPEEGVFTGSKKDEERIFKAGVDAFDKKKYEQALSNFEKVARLNPKNTEASDYVTKIKEILKSKKEIRDLFESADKKCKKEKWADAIPLLEKARSNQYIKQDSNYMDVLRTLSDAYMRTDQLDKAFLIYEELKAQNQNLFFVNFNIAQIYLSRGEYDKGEEALVQAGKADGITPEQVKMVREIQGSLAWKRNVIYLYGLGFLIVVALGAVLFFFNSPAARKKRFLQKLDELRSVSNWNEIINIGSNASHTFTVQENVKFNIMLSTACYNIEKYDEGIRYAKKSLTYDANLVNANDLLARCFLKKKSTTDEAVFQYKKLLKNDPNNVEVLKLISEYYIKLSKNTDKFVKKESLTDELIEYLKTYAVKEPQNRELSIFMANLLRQRKDTTSNAIHIYENALSNEENTKVREVLAKAYYEAKSFERAIGECKFIFKENIENTQVHRIFIDSHIALGRYNDVCIEYEKLVLLYPNSADLERRLNELKRQNMVIGGTSEDHPHSQQGSGHPSQQSGQVPLGVPMQQSGGSSATDYAKCYDRGCKYMIEKDYTNAISEFKIATKGSAEVKNESYKQLVMCYIKKGLLDLAYEQYKLVRYDQEMMPDMIKELTYNMARAFEEKGKFKEALEIYNIICKVDIGFKDVFDKFDELHSYVSKFS